MAFNNEIRILIADEHPLVRQGIVAIISAQTDMDVVAETSKSDETVRYFAHYQPDLLLMELALPTVGSGVKAITAILAESPDARIAVLSRHEGIGAILIALTAGVKTYMFRTMDTSEVLEEIRLVHAGTPRLHPKVLANINSVPREDRLTHPECEILMMMDEGLSTKEIAKRLAPYIEEATVNMHVAQIFNKLQVDNYIGALRRGINGWTLCTTPARSGH
jgi:two-component system NarL family response regulator